MRRCSPLKTVCLRILVTGAVTVSLGGWTKTNAQGSNAAKEGMGCEKGNVGLTLPAGFCASVFADISVGRDVGRDRDAKFR